ncbi:MAG: GLPGLI family protein [Cruoricaptor ignavus]|nr:GLPGLI family protein [Cruoricaptor ignavus]
MKKNKITPLLIIFSIFIFGQSKRFYYELDFKRDSLGLTSSKDIMVLEINKDSNIFLSNEYIITDSINNLNKDNQIFAYPKFTPIVEFRKNDNKFSFIQNLSMHYYQYETEKIIEWTILNEYKQIGAWKVRKAIANYGGRNWIAFFTQEISMPYGPYVFYGLPGLILEIYDVDNNYHFKMIENKNYDVELNSKNIIENLFNDRKIDILEKNWKKIQINYYNNPIPEYKEGKAVMFTKDGKEYSHNDYKNLEKILRNQIKTFNNPIELSEKIYYK